MYNTKTNYSLILPQGCKPCGAGHTNDPNSIMDYRSAYRRGAGFNAGQKGVINQSVWGR